MAKRGDSRESPAPGIGYYDPDDGSGGRRGARSGIWHPARWWGALWNVRDRCGAFWVEPDPDECNNRGGGLRNLWGERLERIADRFARAGAGADARMEYDAYLEDAYLKAEAATRGHMTKPGSDVNPRDFFWRKGNAPMSAASEELERYWGTGEHSHAGAGVGRPLTFRAWQREQIEQAPEESGWAFRTPLDVR